MLLKTNLATSLSRHHAKKLRGGTSRAGKGVTTSSKFGGVPPMDEVVLDTLLKKLEPNFAKPRVAETCSDIIGSFSSLTNKIEITDFIAS